MVKQYVVEWKDVGYYAQKQPTYEWCFTKDIDSEKMKPLGLNNLNMLAMLAKLVVGKVRTLASSG